MTPLAMAVVKELIKKPQDRTIIDRVGVLNRMNDIHCFEVSGVLDTLVSMLDSAGDLVVDVRSTFLPAPKTWIEFQVAGGDRVGWLIDEEKDEILFIDRTDRLLRTTSVSDLLASTDERWMQLAVATSRVLLTAIVLINSPRLIGRRQHMPHRGLERELLRRRKIVGKFPLNAWTEIRLDIAPAIDAAADASVEAHLTGHRAFHFCRAHLRVRNGRPEIVRAHWRGDPDLGIRRSRYVLTNSEQKNGERHVWQRNKPG